MVCHDVLCRCILDTKPRSFTAEDQKLLAQLATMVIKEVERREQLNDAVGRTILQPEEEQQTMAASVAADRCVDVGMQVAYAALTA